MTSKILKYVYFLFVLVRGQEIWRAVDIKVVCTSNCNPSYLELPVELTVECEGCEANQVFVWSVSPIMGYFNFAKDTITKQSGRKLQLKENVFKNKDAISFMAIAWGQAGEIQITFHEKPPTYYIKCEDNCPIVDRQKDAKFSVVCDPNCKNAVLIWSLYPIQMNFDWSLVQLENDNQTIIFKANSLESKWQYNLFLDVNGVKQNLSISTSLADTQLHLHCQSNCEEFVLVDEPYEIIAMCIECKDGGTIIWTVVPPITRFTMSGYRKNQFTIPANTFLGGIVGNITAFLEGAGEDSKTFTTKGTCFMTPDFGHPGTTNFHVDCQYLDETEVYVFQKVDKADLEDPGVLLYVGNVKELKKHDLWLFPGKPAHILVLINQFDHAFELRPNVSEFLQSKYIGLETIITHRYFGKNNSEGSFTHALWKKDWNRVIQSAVLIISQLKDLSNADFISHFKFHILTSIVINVDDIPYEQALTLMLMISRNITEAREGHVIAETISNALERIPSDIPYSKTKRLSSEVLGSYMFIANLFRTVDEKLSVPAYVDEYIFDYHDVYFMRAKNLFHLKWTNDFIIKGIELLANFGMEYDELTLTSYAEGMGSYTQRLGKNNVIQNKQMMSSYVSLPKKWMEKSEEPQWHIQLAIIRPNIFWWHRIGKLILSEMIMVNVYYSKSRLAYFGEHIDLFIESNNTIGTTITGNLTKEIAVIYKILGNRGGTLFLEFRHLGTDYFIFFSPTYPYIQNAKHHGLRVVRTNQSTIYMKNKFIYLVVHKYLPDVSPYEIHVKLLTCITWDERTRKWSNKFCRLGTYSTDSHTHCQCKHFSLFAVSHSGLTFTKAALTDRLIILDIPEASNLCLVILGVILVLWCLLMIIADNRDRVLSRNSIVTKPIDTMPGDEHLYLVSVETGIYAEAGTTSTVVLQMFGDRKSRKHIISGIHRLEKDNNDFYAIYCPQYLGKIHSIRLFHDVSGRNPHWYCRRVIIKHIRSRTTYKFKVLKWFSLLRGDGRVDRMITEKDSCQTKENFKNQLWNEFRLDSVQLGMLFRPPASSFSAKERTAIAFTILLVTMCTCLLFTGIADLDGWENKESLYIGLNEFITIGESLLVCVPLLFLIVVLFKKTRPFMKLAGMQN